MGVRKGLRVVSGISVLVALGGWTACSSSSDPTTGDGGAVAADGAPVAVGDGATSSGGGDGGPGGIGPRACTITLSGALTGTYDCGAAIRAITETQLHATVGRSAQNGPRVQISCGVANPPAPGVYERTDAGPANLVCGAGIDVFPADGGDMPLAQWGFYGPNMAVQMTLDTVTPVLPDAGMYAITGSAKGSLPPTPGVTDGGPLTFTVTF